MGAVSMTTRDKIASIVGALLLLALLIGAQTLAAGDELGADDHHCQMVQLYKDTGGAKGWPDYDPSINCGGE